MFLHYSSRACDARRVPPRAAALLPVGFYAWAVAVNLLDHTPANDLWLCNVLNLVLAAGLALAWPRGVALATLWLVVTVPIWAVDAALVSGFEVHSFATHFGALGLGLYAARRAPWPRGLWWQALVFLAGLQIVTRLVTPAAENVNAAFAPYGPLARLCPAYPAFWLANTATFAVALFAVERVVRRAQRVRAG
jgi:hypothetical protein